MGFFTTRERAELDKSGEAELEGRVREFVRRDATPLRRPPDSDLVAGNVGSLLQRVTGTSLKEIDNLIAELSARREKLLSESARVQREVIEYAKLSQSTMQSTKIITESLSYWNKVPEQPGNGEPHVEEAPRKPHARSRAESFAPRGDEHAQSGRHPEATVVPVSARPEPSADPDDAELDMR